LDINEVWNINDIRNLCKVLPEERIIRGTLADIASQVEKAGITRTAIIAVGEVLAQAPPPVLSKLYDKNFSHGYRA